MMIVGSAKSMGGMESNSGRCSNLDCRRLVYNRY